MASFNSLEARLRKSGFKVIAGIDEAGRGPLAGPVVCAAVVLKKSARIRGLNDSKLLTEKKRLDLFPKIIESCHDYSITIIPPSRIDEINILNAVKEANFLCARHLNKKPDIVLIDGNDKQFLEIPHRTIIKGDQKIRSIAAASVLAKVTRDYIMQHYSKLFPVYLFEKHKGYPTRQHRKLVKKHGPCEIHRKSYKVEL